jgi:hypothetical protein
MTEPTIDLSDDRHNAMYRAELSALYHRKRERFLALCDRVGKAVALVAGTAAFSSVLSSAEMKSWAGLVVAGATLPGLVLAWSDKARLHSELAQKYIAIQAEIAGTITANLSEQLICDWQSRLRQIEAAEPPTLTALVRLCQNQLAEAAGQQDVHFPLSRTERWFAHVFDMQRTKT